MFLESSGFQKIIQALQKQQQSQFSSDSPTSILLLDAENLRDLDAEVEAFLSHLSTYPLTVKLAFANWKKTGGDTELYQRGYQMIHVPLGKDSADAQMIAMGAAISQHYSQAKEVFVCSSDWLFTYLMTELQHQGFSVYRVSKKQPKKFPKVLTVEQMNTGEIKSYSIPKKAEIPTPQDLMDKIQTLINETHDSLEERLDKLSQINQLFEIEKQLISTQNPDRSQTEISNSNGKLEPASQQTASDSTEDTVLFKSKEQLETAIKSILTTCLEGSQQETVTISELAIEFKKVYGEPPKNLIKKLKLAANLYKFLQNFASLIVIKKKNIYHVGFKEPSIPGITSQEDVEKILIKIMEDLQPKYENNFVPLEVLSQQFQLDYKISLSQLLKELEIAGKFITFVKSCETFVVKKQDNKYHVRLS
ncbi:MAG: NYN domain-containing protein [Cyanobacteria bacterium J06592_8]